MENGKLVTCTSTQTMCTATLREPERGVLKKKCNLETALTGHTGTESVCLSGIRSSSGECSFHIVWIGKLMKRKVKPKQC